jgi:hypothetical protein
VKILIEKEFIKYIDKLADDADDFIKSAEQYMGESRRGRAYFRTTVVSRDKVKDSIKKLRKTVNEDIN